MKWLFSATARHANAACKHVEKILNHQRDILTPNAISQVETAIGQTRATIAAGADKTTLEKQIASLDEAATKWLKPYPNAAWRENVEVLLVALAVAMAVRTFFLQPFKIPTGSMQPTLYGVTSKVLSPDFKIPTGLQRIKEWFQGTSYLHIVAPEDGEFQGAEEPVRLAIFNIYQKLHFAGKTISIWFPPDYGSEGLAPSYGGTHSYPRYRSDAQLGQIFKKGEDIIKVKVNAGDHLFVDRVSYNFRAPERGDIVVFETHGITEMTSWVPNQGDTFYIKRLVGLGGETLELQRDYDVAGVPGAGDLHVPVGHLVVDGKPLSASTQHFENLYSFSGAGKTNSITYQENHYYGHALLQRLAPGRSFTVGTNNFFVMGDNTMNSSDSRYWGDFPQSKVIGRSFFVYWPITDRFGWSSSR
ncbi:MAG TPA: signal peptidase I [Candidatus Paceibacterota bacterium]|nr:signal peptidase I [Candidatus Paceibacterota bacterium]